MDLESEDEDKENGGDDATVKDMDEDEEVDEKERSHCMEEMWDEGIINYQLKSLNIIS